MRYKENTSQCDKQGCLRKAKYRKITVERAVPKNVQPTPGLLKAFSSTVANVNGLTKSGINLFFQDNKI